MTVLASIDYSMNSPAICVYDTEDEYVFESFKFYNIGTLKTRVGLYNNIEIKFIPDYLTQEERFRNLTSWASNILATNKVTEVCIEGYSLGASSGLVFQIAENTSLIKQYMDLNGIKFFVIPPTQVKKTFHGKGNAKKDAMVGKFYELFPDQKLHDILGIKEMTKPIDDIVDSFAIINCHKHFTGV